MKHNYHSRKVRQLDRLIKEMKQSMKARQPKAFVDRIRQKIAVLIRELRGVLSYRQLAHKLGALAIVFGFANGANAQQFAAPVENPFGFVADTNAYVGGIVTADFDNDGDYDILIGGYYGSIDYYENTGTAAAPIFGQKQVNPFGLASCYYYAFLTAADLDNDGDLDVLAGEYYGNYKYFENLGSATNPLFAAPQTNPFNITQGYSLAMPELADIDDDGDFDLISGIASDFNYMENTGTANAPNFAAPITDPFGMTFTSSYFAYPSIADLDMDGDLDVLVGEYYGNFKYYQNAGTASNPIFAGAQQNPFGLAGNVTSLMFPAFVDIDDDGDLDVIGSSYGGSIWFFENTQFNAGVDEIANNVAMGPNPFISEVNFSTDTQLDLVEVLDMTGKLVYSEVNPNGSINLENLKKGVYLIQVIDSEGNISRQKLEKQ